MKNKLERAKSRSQGGHERDVIMEALELICGRYGTATTSQILELVEKDMEFGIMPNKSISFYLRNMDGVEKVGEGVWRIVDQSPKMPVRSNGATAARANEGDRVKLTLEQSNRAAFVVTIYTEPVRFEKVIQVRVMYEGVSGWKRQPIFGNIRVCFGPGEVDWGAERIAERGIVAVQLIYKSGETQEFPNLNPSHTITFAEEE